MERKRLLGNRKANQVAYVYPNNTLQTMLSLTVLTMCWILFTIPFSTVSEAWADWSWDILGNLIGR